MNSKTAVLTVMALAATAASAHDFWIRPASFRPAPGDHVTASLRVGEPFRGTDVERRASHLERFTLFSTGRTALAGREGATPAGLFRATGRGLQVIAYESRPVPHEMPPRRFAAYLSHAGLVAVAGGRSAGNVVRERFKRCAKSLIAVGDAKGADRAVGLPLELVAETNPYTVTVGDELVVVLLHHGRPLEGALVAATSAEDPGDVLRRRTDGSGRVAVGVRHAGVWLITAVHIGESPSPRFDWDSLWASLTFEIPEPTDPSAR